MQHPEQENTYVLDAEQADEAERLLRQGNLLTRIMVDQAEGKLFPLVPDQEIRSVLDLGCGSGDWILGVCEQAPHIAGVGVDVAGRMVAYARSFAATRKISNARFEVMNISNGLAFPDASFDLVNARLLVAVLYPSAWPAMLKEIRRVLKPGGYFRWVESESTFSNSEALERVMMLCAEAFRSSGRGWNVTRSQGITVHMPQLLRDAGFEHIRYKAYAVEGSRGGRDFQAFFTEIKDFSEAVEEFITATTNISKEEYQHLSKQIVVDMLSEDFRSMGYLLEVCAQRPAQDAPS